MQQGGLPSLLTIHPRQKKRSLNNTGEGRKKIERSEGLISGHYRQLIGGCRQKMRGVEITERGGMKT